jgi:TonB family protein
VKFYAESPGPSRPNANRNAAPSDKTRRAGGGDKSKPASETPFVAQKSGIDGLRPGPRGKEGSRASAPTPAPTPAQASPQSAAAPSSTAPSPAGTAPSGVSVTPGATQRLPNLNRAIKAAAGNPFSGEGGAPNPNESGGFVDSGPISFDTQWYDWGDYAEEMLRKIKIHWYEHIPKLAELGPDGKLTIRFYIRADGSVEGENVVKSSTIPPYDHAAFLGVSEASPFRPLPRDLHEDREGVTITFLYLHYRAGDKPPQIPDH